MSNIICTGVAGEGAYGRVLKCRIDESDGSYSVIAMKYVRPDEPESFWRESTILMSIWFDDSCQDPRRENIIALRGRPGRLDAIFVIPMELCLCSFQDLIRAGRNYDSDQAGLEQVFESPNHYQYYLYCLFRGLAYLHARGIAHLDIKPDNVMVKSNGGSSPRTGINNIFDEVKIVDFGCAVYVHEYPFIERRIVTAPYRPPECSFLGRKISTSIDVWSSIILSIEISLGAPLFPRLEYVHDDEQFDVEHRLRLISLLGIPTLRELGDIDSVLGSDYLSSLDLDKIPWPDKICYHRRKSPNSPLVRGDKFCRTRYEIVEDTLWSCYLFGLNNKLMPIATTPCNCLEDLECDLNVFGDMTFRRGTRLSLPDMEDEFIISPNPSKAFKRRWLDRADRQHNYRVYYHSFYCLYPVNHILLISKILVFNPKDRVTAEEIMEDDYFYALRNSDDSGRGRQGQVGKFIKNRGTTRRTVHEEQDQGEYRREEIRKQRMMIIRDQEGVINY